MSIKVAVRVRPFNNRERNSDLCIKMPDKSTTIIKNLENKSEKSFNFDYSIWSHDGFIEDSKGYCLKDSNDSSYSDQRDVYEKLGKEILHNAWEGYNCCLFAYGQTGSGKSYSMVGYGVNIGIVPIICEEIFKKISTEEQTNKNIKFEVQVSMIEIYNEKVFDLLVDINQRQNLKIRENKIIGIYVEGLTKYKVHSYNDIENKMTEGYENRTISSTLMNSCSSRAHTIINIEFKKTDLMTNTIKSSNINLVDLAGSERSSATGASGARLKEGCNINKSLLILGNVINILADKSSNNNKTKICPPYRESSLTRILQNALGGNSKTVMICALSPSFINYEETLSTLRYADRAKKIQNKAVINESEQDKILRLLKEENKELKGKIEELSIRLFTKNPNNKDIKDNNKSDKEDKYEFEILKEQIESNIKIIENLEKEDKQDNKQKDTNNLRLASSLNTIDYKHPYLIVLNEDPQLSEKLKYSLKTLPLKVGRKNANPIPEIKLSGIGIKLNHCLFNKITTHNEDEYYISAIDKEANENIFINGIKLSILLEDDEDKYFLNHLDKILLGQNTLMVFALYKVDKLGFDWEDAITEVSSLAILNETSNKRDQNDDLIEVKNETNTKANISSFNNSKVQRSSIRKSICMLNNNINTHSKHNDNIEYPFLSKLSYINNRILCNMLIKKYNNTNCIYEDKTFSISNTNNSIHHSKFIKEGVVISKSFITNSSDNNYINKKYFRINYKNREVSNEPLECNKTYSDFLLLVKILNSKINLFNSIVNKNGFNYKAELFLYYDYYDFINNEFSDGNVTSIFSNNASKYIESDCVYNFIRIIDYNELKVCYKSTFDFYLILSKLELYVNSLEDEYDEDNSLTSNSDSSVNHFNFYNADSLDSLLNFNHSIYNDGDEDPKTKEKFNTKHKSFNKIGSCFINISFIKNIIPFELDKPIFAKELDIIIVSLNNGYPLGTASIIVTGKIVEKNGINDLIYENKDNKNQNDINDDNTNNKIEVLEIQVLIDKITWLNNTILCKSFFFDFNYQGGYYIKEINDENGLNTEINSDNCQIFKNNNKHKIDKVDETAYKEIFEFPINEFLAHLKRNDITTESFELNSNRDLNMQKQDSKCDMSVSSKSSDDDELFYLDIGKEFYVYLPLCNCNESNTSNILSQLERKNNNNLQRESIIKLHNNILVMELYGEETIIIN